MAQDIWIYDLKANHIEQMPHTEWTDTFPMWHGDTIYFDSDRGPEHQLRSLQLQPVCPPKKSSSSHTSRILM